MTSHELGRNIKLLIEYDGTRYHGWQRQANASTIQQTLEEGIAQVVGHEVTLCGSGRTDAGVHALGQVANFRTSTRLAAERLPHAINAHVPDDIAVLRAEDAPADFHARYSAKCKTYRYRIVRRPVRPAVGAAFVHWHRFPLDVAAMRQAAALFLGEHDFAVFESHSAGEGTVRTVSRSELVEAGERLDYYVAANGFLYNMVRAMVGTLLEVGSGKRPPEDVTRLLESRDRTRAGRTAPARGLCLMQVDYE
ncbi:MAG TPA: tRNA pseudouridine(38-40) synthase TruA [Planctomycetota bacterium]|nr:tRNA pseudouridine(38-40) synthase TruA [Planctomycetota bacterium]HRR78757.1 tRNA pseudouridine(38-40) synthase TruA [Planctomycetota bacterium]HRT95230.1 tRNA pseudouridine(38-40) synthase TruA [Planctomycetota bacterium]